MKYMDWDNMITSLEALYILDNAMTDPSEDDLRLIKKKKMQLLKKVKILQHQWNSILRKSLILKIRVFKDKKIQLLVKKQLIGLPLLKANIE